MSLIPSVGRTVHYTSYGTPGGEYGKECRAAIITEVNLAVDGTSIGLAVLNPTGMFFNNIVDYDTACSDGSGNVVNELTGGTWHWPERTE